MAISGDGAAEARVAMRKRSAVEGLTSAVGGIAGALRRRREDARPRVRVRFGREQAVVLADDDRAARAILAAARELVDTAGRAAGDQDEPAAPSGDPKADEARAEHELEELARVEASTLPEPGPPAGPDTGASGSSGEARP